MKVATTRASTSPLRRSAGYHFLNLVMISGVIPNDDEIGFTVTAGGSALKLRIEIITIPVPITSNLFAFSPKINKLRIDVTQIPTAVAKHFTTLSAYLITRATRMPPIALAVAIRMVAGDCNPKIFMTSPAAPEKATLLRAKTMLQVPSWRFRSQMVTAGDPLRTFSRMTEEKPESVAMERTARTPMKGFPPVAVPVLEAEGSTRMVAKISRMSDLQWPT